MNSVSSTERFELEVSEQVQKAERVDKVLAATYSDRSRSQIQRALDAGLIMREDVVLSKKSKVAAGDVLSISWVAAVEQSAQPVDIPLEVLFEDEHLIAVSKPVGMVTHPGVGTGPDTLVHALLFHCKEGLASIGAPDRPGIVHRLDKETSGVIVVAKTDRAYHALVEQFSERTMRKEYLALVSGLPKENAGTIQQAIGRHPVHRTRMAVRPHGKFAHTDWRCLRAVGNASLVSCRIHTGRTHQIRVHMQYLGYPLLGDSNYGFKAARFSGIGVPRVMLHAHTLELDHPILKKRMLIEARLPEDFETLMAELVEN
ncbi:MAG: RluA family pseudouridine synthase [Verrucomicrobiota bacterium]